GGDGSRENELTVIPAFPFTHELLPAPANSSVFGNTQQMMLSRTRSNNLRSLGGPSYGVNANQRRYWIGPFLATFVAHEFRVAANPGVESVASQQPPILAGGRPSVMRKRNLSNALCALILVSALLVCAPQALSQTKPPAAPAQAQTPPEGAAFWESLTPYQKSQIEHMYNDWAFLAKYRDADASLPSVQPDETRVVFMGDSITEGWGMKATATSPARGEFF